MTCKEAIAKLAEYLDAELTPAVVAKLEAHLRECAPCGSLLLTPGRPAAAVSVSVSIPTDFPRAANLMTREGCLNGESLGRICHG